LSVYLRDAAFTALKHFDPSIVLNCDSWHALISKYATLPYIIHSAYVPKVIFGNLNPKAQTIIQKFLTQHVLNHLKSSSLNQQIFSVSSEEIFLATTAENFQDDFQKLTAIVQTAKFGENFLIDGFRVVHLSGTRPYFVKEFFGNGDLQKKLKVEFINVPMQFYPMALKFYYKLDLQEFDRKFLFEGVMATYDKSIFHE